MTQTTGTLPSTEVAAFTLHSDDLSDGSALPAAHAATSTGGQNRSPHLAWHAHPPQTKSFAVTCYDPDAPTGSGFWHWLTIDIPATHTELLAGEPNATSIANDLGNPGYDGAAPPPGPAHRYVFTVHALDVPYLDIPPGATNAFVRYLVNAHTIASASLHTTYAT